MKLFALLVLAASLMLVGCQPSGGEKPAGGATNAPSTNAPAK